MEILNNTKHTKYTNKKHPCLQHCHTHWHCKDKSHDLSTYLSLCLCLYLGT